MSWVGVALFAALALAAILAPLIAPFDPIDQRIVARMSRRARPICSGPTGSGATSSLAPDGVRASLVIGIASVAAGMLVGGALGVIAGYYGRFIDAAIMRTMDVLLSFPTLIMGILIVALLGPSLPNVLIAISATLVPKFARIARAPTLAVKERAYIEACRALGYSDGRIIVFHIVPNILAKCW